MTNSQYGNKTRMHIGSSLFSGGLCALWREMMVHPYGICRRRRTFWIRSRWSSVCVVASAAKAAKYGPLQGFLGAGGAYRGKSLTHTPGAGCDGEMRAWPLPPDALLVVSAAGGAAGCQGKYCGRRKWKDPQWSTVTSRNHGATAWSRMYILYANKPH